MLYVGMPLTVLVLQVWAIGNVAGDSAQARDEAIKAGALEPIAALVRNGRNTKISILRNATWSLSNLCRFVEDLLSCRRCAKRDCVTIVDCVTVSTA